ncbi:MAG: LytR family transcriptional regulator [Candidatus Paraimprobicoccus trichonymphae]|uniref:LytR family transcriptional regulator n=1 Tax=Candidatus Paraimprobicoccus trichonymphae TaxID=3033793 RepID=A0AA48HW66_9FIRM|nr:MAG: LytR family transcriptional regulator [Candidatus Paraimprobicoccus trichonymphae]
MMLFFTLLGGVGAFFIYIYTVIKSFKFEEIQSTPIRSKIGNGSNYDQNSGNNIDNMVLNILLLGVDGVSKNDRGRSDTILVISLNVRTKKIKIVSIMRDTWCVIPKHGSDRINAAYSYGGANLTAETIQLNFGIPIDRYVWVKFDDFVVIINILGGIDLNLTTSEVNYINKYSGYRPQLIGSGFFLLNGIQTLRHAQNRNSIGSDYDRTRRQRDILIALFNKSKNLNLIQLASFISNIIPMINTNFNSREIAKLTSNISKYLNYNLEQLRIPTDDNVMSKTIDGKSVLVIPDKTETKQYLNFALS